MNQKTFSALIALCLFLAVAYFCAVPGTAPQTGSNEQRLLQGIQSESVSEIALEQGADKLELRFKDGLWRVPARGGYQADTGKVRAFLLKLFDIEVSQLVPSDEKSAERLGVSGDAVKRGMGLIRLLDSKGNKLVGVHLGEARKGKEKSAFSPQSGQYVRRDDQEDVYLISSPISLSLGAENWIDVNLLNVLPVNIKKVIQVQRENQIEALLFELQNTGQSDKSGQPMFSLTSELPQGKSLQDPIVTQIRAALENFRISDVREATSSELKDLVFDFMTKFNTTTALVYTVESAEKDQKSYVRIHVEYDAELAKLLTDEAQKSASSSSVSSSPSENAENSSAAASTAAVEKKPELKLSNAEEAKKLNDQLKDWVYVVPMYNARKLRFTLKDLTEPPPPPPKQEGEALPDGEQ